MTIGAITTGLQAGITATGAVTPTTGLDVSGITGDWTIKVEIPANTAGKKARLVIESSANGFTASVPELIVDISDKTLAASDRVFSVRKYERPSHGLGVTSAVLRARVDKIDSGNSLSVQAWIEY